MKDKIENLIEKYEKRFSEYESKLQKYESLYISETELVDKCLLLGHQLECRTILNDLKLLEMKIND